MYGSHGDIKHQGKYVQALGTPYTRLPGGSQAGKEYPCSTEDLGSLAGLGRYPGEGNGNPLQLFLPGGFHG